MVHVGKFIGDSHIIDLCSGITRSRVLNEELYAQSFQKLINLHLLTNCVIKISPQSSEQAKKDTVRIVHQGRN